MREKIKKAIKERISKQRNYFYLVNSIMWALNRINGEKTFFRYIGPEIINGTAWETKRLRYVETTSKHSCGRDK